MNAPISSLSVSNNPTFFNYELTPIQRNEYLTAGPNPGALGYAFGFWSEPALSFSY
jgi:hypothetical protein